MNRADTEFPAYNLLYKHSSKRLYLTPQHTSFTCGVAAYITISRSNFIPLTQILSKELEITLHTRFHSSLITLAVSFVKMAEVDNTLDRVEGIYFYKSKHDPSTLSKEALKLISSFEGISDKNELEMIKEAYEKDYIKYKKYARVYVREDDFFPEFLKKLQKPELNIATLIYLDKKDIATPHWIVPFAITTCGEEKCVLIYEPFTNAIAWITLEKLRNKMLLVENLGFPPQFVVFKSVETPIYDT